MPYCIGVTGGIGSGKSMAATLFAELGAAVVDTDAIAHDLTGPGGNAMPAIAAAFGATMIAADGSLDRAAMRRHVFENPQARRQLETILHPLIGERARRAVIGATSPYVLLVVPLLLETGGYRDLVRRVLVIDCDESLQISRAMQRSNLTREAVSAIMAAQLPRARRLADADDVIHNNGDIAHLRDQVTRLHQEYQSRAAGAPDGTRK